MFVVYVGDLPSSAMNLVRKFAGEFLVDYTVDVLGSQGSKSKLRNSARKSDVAFIVLDETLYNMCEGVTQGALSLSKVHKYNNDKALADFLSVLFQPIDLSDIDLDSTQEVNDDLSTLTSSFGTMEQATVVKVKETVKETAEVEPFVNIDDDATKYALRISSLTRELAEKTEELKEREEKDFIVLGKVAKAEEVLEQLNTLKISNRDLDDRLIAEQITVTRLTTELSNCKDTIDECNGTIEVLRGIESNYRILVKEKESLNKTIQDLEDLRDKLQADSHKLGVRVKSLETEIDNLQEYVADRRTLNNRVLELEPKLAKATEDIAGLRSQVSVLNELKVQVSNLTSELEKANSRIDRYSAKISINTETISKLEKDKTTLESDLSDLQIKFSTLEDEKQRLLNNLSETKEILSTTKTEKADLSNKYTSLYNSFESLDSQYSDLQLSLSSLHQKYQEQGIENSGFKESIVRLDNDLKLERESNESLQGKLTSLKADYVKVSSRLEGVLSENKDLNDRVSNLREKLFSEGDRLSVLETDFSNCKLALSTEQSINTSLKQDILKEKELTDSLRNAEIELNKTLVDLKNTLSEQNAKVVRLTSDTSGLKSLLQTSESKAEDLEKEVSNLRIESDEKDSKLKDFEFKLSNSELTLEQLKDEHATAIADNKGYLERIELLLADAESLTSQLEANKNTLLQYSAEKESLTKSVSKLKEKLEESLSSNTDLEETNNQLQSKFTKLLSENSSLQDNSSELNETLTGLSDEITELRSSLKGVKLELGKATELNNSLDLANKDLSSKVSSLTEQGESLIKAKSELKLKLDKALDLNKQLSDSLSKLSTSSGDLDSQLSDSLNRESDLKSSVIDLEGKLEDIISERDSLSVKFKSALLSLDEKDAVNKTLEGSILGLNKEIQDMSALKSSIQEKLNSEVLSSTKLADENTALKESLINLDSMYAENERLQGLLDTSDTNLSKLKAEYNEVASKLAFKEEDLAGIAKEKADLQQNVLLLKKSLADAEESKRSISSSLANLEEQLSNSSLSQDEIVKLNKTKIDELLKNLQIAETELDTLRSESSLQNKEIQGYIEKVKLLNEDLLTSKSKLSALQDVYDKLSSTSVNKVELDTLNETISELTSNNAKLTNKISILEENDYNALLLEHTKLQETAETLTKDLITAQQSIDTLTEGNRNLKIRVQVAESDDDLQGKVNELENALNSEKGNVELLNIQLEEKGLLYSNSLDEIDVLNKNISGLTSQLQESNTRLSEESEYVKEITSGVAFSVMNSARPKSVLNTYLQTPNKALSNVVVVAGGGAGSLTSISDFVMREVQGLKQNFVVVDLANEGYLDLNLQLTDIKNPVDWLCTSKDIMNILSSTKFKNVKATSLAMFYLNDAYILSIDWSKKLLELNDLGVTVILNVGCLGDFVRNMLFSSFSKCCRSLVITHSSPSNLRATLLHLKSFEKVQNTSLVFMDFNKKLSEKAYQSLSKYNRIILDDKQVLKL